MPKLKKGKNRCKKRLFRCKEKPKKTGEKADEANQNARKSQKMEIKRGVKPTPMQGKVPLQVVYLLLEGIKRGGYANVKKNLAHI